MAVSRSRARLGWRTAAPRNSGGLLTSDTVSLVSQEETTAPPAARTGFASLPRWLRIGMVAAVTAVGVLIIAVVIRIVLQTPVIPTGSTPVAQLLPGSCLVEPGSDDDRYTVVPCSTPH